MGVRDKNNWVTNMIYFMKPIPFNYLAETAKTSLSGRIWNASEYYPASFEVKCKVVSHCQRSFSVSISSLFLIFLLITQVLGATDERVLTVLTYVGCSFSIVGVFLSAITFLSLPWVHKTDFYPVSTVNNDTKNFVLFLMKGRLTSKAGKFLFFLHYEKDIMFNYSSQSYFFRSFCYVSLKPWNYF